MVLEYRASLKWQSITWLFSKAGYRHRHATVDKTVTSDIDSLDLIPTVSWSFWLHLWLSMVFVATDNKLTKNHLSWIKENSPCPILLIHRQIFSPWKPILRGTAESQLPCKFTTVLSLHHAITQGKSVAQSLRRWTVMHTKKKIQTGFPLKVTLRQPDSGCLNWLNF